MKYNEEMFWNFMKSKKTNIDILDEELEDEGMADMFEVSSRKEGMDSRYSRDYSSNKPNSSFRK